MALKKRASAVSGVDSPSANGGRLAVVENNSWICMSINAGGLSNLQLSYFWRGDPDANESSDDGLVEYHTSGGGASCSSFFGWNTLQNHDLQNDGSWTTQSAFTLPSALNNTTFFLRYRASSDNNEYFRIDGVLLTSGSAAPTCQLGVDLSWNGGTSWSSEKTVTLAATETTYTLGSASDEWGSHSWVPTEFSNTNFRARIHTIDPGNGCSGAEVEHVDFLRARVHYTISSSPSDSALNAADAAKISDTTIFTIHFGSDPRGIWAESSWQTWRAVALRLWVTKTARSPTRAEL